MTNANPFAAFQAQQPVQPNAAQPVVQQQQPTQPAGNPFGAAPVQQHPQTMQPVQVAPAAGAFGQPQQPAVQQPQAGFSQLPDLGDVGESGREPGIPRGLSLLLFKSAQVKTFTGHTAIALFTMVSHTPDPSTPADVTNPGSTVGFVKKLPTDSAKKKTAIGYALPMIRSLAGFNDEATFKAQVPYWSQLLAAFIFGDPKFAEWANGKKVGTRGTQGEEIIDKKTGNRTGRYYVQLEWFPVPQQ